MKITVIEYNVKTGNKEIREVELTEQETIEREKQERESFVRRRMDEIKVELSQTDYLTMKFIEGELSDEEYEPHKAHRASLREEYNRLENELS